MRENRFTERGAESLNLKVRGFNAQTLRTNLGIGVARPFGLVCAEVIPQIYVAWVHDLFLDSRTIRSNLKPLGGSFKVHGYNRDRNGFLGTASLMVRHANGLIAEGSYDVEIDDYFTSQSVKLDISWCF